MKRKEHFKVLSRLLRFILMEEKEASLCLVSPKEWRKEGGREAAGLCTHLGIPS